MLLVAAAAAGAALRSFVLPIKHTAPPASRRRPGPARGPAVHGPRLNMRPSHVRLGARPAARPRPPRRRCRAPPPHPRTHPAGPPPARSGARQMGRLVRLTLTHADLASQMRVAAHSHRSLGPKQGGALECTRCQHRPTQTATMMLTRSAQVLARPRAARTRCSRCLAARSRRHCVGRMLAPRRQRLPRPTSCTPTRIVAARSPREEF